MFAEHLSTPLDTLPTIVRTATADDAEEVVGHLRAIATEGTIGLHDTEIDIAEERRRLAGLDPEQAAALVVCNGTRIVALAIAVRQSGVLGHTAVVAVSVERAFRRRRFASALLCALEAWGRHHGIRKLCASVMGHNLAARSLFIRAGYLQEGFRPLQLQWNGTPVDEVLFGRVLGDGKEADGNGAADHKALPPLANATGGGRAAPLDGVRGPRYSHPVATGGDAAQRRVSQHP